MSLIPSFSGFAFALFCIPWTAVKTSEVWVCSFFPILLLAGLFCGFIAHPRGCANFSYEIIEVWSLRGNPGKGLFEEVKGPGVLG